MKISMKLAATEVDKVQDIPGLHVTPAGLSALGHADAISAAQLRLGKPARTLDVAPTKWPEDSKLRAYQQRGVEFIVERTMLEGGVLLADDTGLGKTLQAITSLKFLQGRVLVVAPAAARETWRDELAKWGEKSVAVLSPNPTKASQAEWDTAHTKRIVVCSYHHQTLEKMINVAFPVEQPQVLILDEAHRIRGRKSKRSKALDDIAPLCRYRIALTATPQFDRPRDFWQILHIILGNRFGTRWTFDAAYCGGKHNAWGGWENKGATNTEELKHRLNWYMLARSKKDVAKELPPLTRVVRWVDGTTSAKRSFSAFALGLGRETLHRAQIEALKGKMAEACTLAQEAKRFLLVTWMREHAKGMCDTLNRDYDTPCLWLHGGLTTEKRAAVVREAQARGIGLVATIDAVSESLNLQGLASNMIVHHLDFVAQKHVQLEGRLHRLGQKDPVLVQYVAMQESVDKIILPVIVEKLDQMMAVMGRDKRDLRHTLGDAVDGPAARKAEEDALKRIYKEMQ